jgi:hypothetical protein
MNSPVKKPLAAKKKCVIIVGNNNTNCIFKTLILQGPLYSYGNTGKKAKRLWPDPRSTVAAGLANARGRCCCQWRR